MQAFLFISGSYRLIIVARHQNVAVSMLARYLLQHEAMPDFHSWDMSFILGKVEEGIYSLSNTI